jgi:hypothetical protein
MSEPSSDEADLTTLFAEERTFEEPMPDDVRSRVRAVLATKLDLRRDGDTNGEPDDRAPSAAPTASLPRKHAVLGMISTFLVGGWIGGAIVRAAAPTASSLPAASVSASSAAPVATAPAGPATTTAASALPVDARSAPPPSARAPTPKSSTVALEDDAGLAAERALLDAARVAFASDEPTDALAMLGRHAQRFPRGRLVEEREALTVRALVKARRFDEARARAARFKEGWPRSLATPAVNAAIESIP